MIELWNLLISAEKNEGIPEQLLEAEKKAAEEHKVSNTSQRAR